MNDSVITYSQGDAKLIVHQSWCKGCDVCIEACPVDILKLDETDKIKVTDIDKCIFCGICAERCPDFCFSLERAESPKAIWI